MMQHCSHGGPSLLLLEISQMSHLILSSSTGAGQFGLSASFNSNPTSATLLTSNHDPTAHVASYQFCYGDHGHTACAAMLLFVDAGDENMIEEEEEFIDVALAHVEEESTGGSQPLSNAELQAFQELIRRLVQGLIDFTRDNDQDSFHSAGWNIQTWAFCCVLTSEYAVPILTAAIPVESNEQLFSQVRQSTASSYLCGAFRPDLSRGKDTLAKEATTFYMLFTCVGRLPSTSTCP